MCIRDRLHTKVLQFQKDVTYFAINPFTLIGATTRSGLLTLSLIHISGASDIFSDIEFTSLGYYALP